VEGKEGINMLSIAMARQLQQAGLNWIPAQHDFFTLPDSELADKVFIITDMMAYVELLQGRPVATFHGTVEWALDYVTIAELLWLPREEQLRQLLLDKLVAESDPAVHLESTPGRTVCRITFQGQTRAFEAANAADAYAAALSHVLLHSHLKAAGNGMSA
jgi:hypothetical protein